MVCCGTIRVETITGDSSIIASLVELSTCWAGMIAFLCRVINTITIPITHKNIISPSIIQISEEPDNANVFPPSFSRNIWSLNPISSSPIFIPKVTFRKSDSDHSIALLSCTCRFNERISATFLRDKSSSSGTHFSVNIAWGNVFSFLMASHASNEAPESEESLLWSIFATILSPIPENDIDPIV